MPRRDPQAVFTNSEGTVFGALYGLFSPDEGLAADQFRPEKAPVADVKAHGAKGDGSTNDTTAFKNAISSADANDGTVYVPPGTYLINDWFEIPGGVTLKGAGRDNTTIKSVNNSAQITFHLNSYSELRDFALDQNVQNRTYGRTTGVEISGGQDHCVIDNVSFLNVSESGEGVCIYLDVEESDPQDTFFNRISNCHLTGGWQNGANSGDFLIRGRTAFNSSLADDEFTRFLRNNWIHRCTFTGEGKAAIEWVGPAVRGNLTTDCVAIDFTTCVGIFESSHGGKHNTFVNCYIYNCYGDSTCIGFYSDGHSPNTTSPARVSEDDLFIGCHVINFHQTSDGSDIRAFRVRRGDRITFSSCFADNISTPAGSTGIAIGVDVHRADDARLNSMTIQGVDEDVTFATVDRPRWNGVIGAGPFGGVDLATTTGRYEGDAAMSGDHYSARWTGSQWRRSDGTLV